MRRINRRMVRNITEQTTRDALYKQQLNEKALWNLGKAAVGKVGKWLGAGGKAAAGATDDVVKAANAVGKGSQALVPAADAAKLVAADAAKAASSKFWKGALRGAIGGGIGGYALGSMMGGGNSGPQPDPNLMPPGSMAGMPGEVNVTPYPGYGYGGGYSDPYAGYGYGYSDPYAGYGGGYSNPYAGYSGGYSDPYAGYGYGGGYSDPYAGYGYGGSTGGMDPMMMYLMQQGGNNSGYADGSSTGGMDPMMWYAMMNGNMDPAMMMMMMNR